MIYKAEQKVIKISGVDSQKYLQGQITCDLNSFAIGDHSLFAHCDHKGKVNTLARIVKIADDEFWVLVANEIAEQAVNNFKKYAIFSKVTFEQTEKNIYYTKNDFLENKENIVTLQRKDGVVIYISDNLVKNEENITACQNFYKAKDIINGYPCFNQKLVGEEIPQSFNLQDLEQGISFKKGCYLGQEVVARAKFRGLHKKALFGLVAENIDSDFLLENLSIGGQLNLQLEQGVKQTGMITDFCVYNNNLYVQAILHKDIDLQSKFIVHNNILSIINKE